MLNKIEQALNHLRQGKLIIVTDSVDREAEGDLVGVANLVTAEAVNFMAKYGRGLICAPISQKIAKNLALEAMTTHNTDAFHTAFTISVDHQTTSTGISAYDRAKTIRALADFSSQPTDFYRPGHLFPLVGKEGGVLVRPGHTEAALDLARLANQSHAAYICEIMNEDGTMARQEQLQSLAEKWQMPIISIEELSSYLQVKNHLKVQLPTSYGDFELTLYEDDQQNEHLLLSMGDLSSLSEPLLLRIHSECLTGDVFASHRCDCGEQLDLAMRKIAEHGVGAIIYLRQEGRGIGLKHKLQAYQLQEAGLDTYEANVQLGFKPDERDYHFAVKILQELSIDQVQLMTNNPDKIAQLEQAGIQIVKRIPLETHPFKENQFYLQTKKEKFHHLLHV